jgi:hypothetical protein
MANGWKKTTLRLLRVAAFSFAGSYVAAAFFVLMLYVASPASDEARRSGAGALFRNSLLRDIAFMCASCIGAVLIPVFLLCLDKAHWLIEACIALLAALAVIAITAPISPILAIIGSPAATIAALVLIRSYRSDHPYNDERSQ